MDGDNRKTPPAFPMRVLYGFQPIAKGIRLPDDSSISDLDDVVRLKKCGWLFHCFVGGWSRRFHLPQHVPPPSMPSTRQQQWPLQVVLLRGNQWCCVFKKIHLSRVMCGTLAPLTHHRRSRLSFHPPIGGSFTQLVSPNWVGNKKPRLATGMHQRCFRNNQEQPVFSQPVPPWLAPWLANKVWIATASSSMSRNSPLLSISDK